MQQTISLPQKYLQDWKFACDWEKNRITLRQYWYKYSDALLE